MTTSQPKTNKQIIDKHIINNKTYQLTKLWTWQVQAIYPLLRAKSNKLLKVLISGDSFNGNGFSTIITPTGMRLFSDNFDYLFEYDEWNNDCKYIKFSKPNQKYGLLNAQGVQVLDTIYDSIGTPKDNQVNVIRNGQFYTIDLTTLKEYPIANSHHYKRLGEFSQGLCKVSTLPDMDSLFDEEYRLAYFSDYADIAGCWGFINRFGEEVIAPEFIFAHDFDGDIAIVCKGKWYKDPKWNNEYNQNRYWTDTKLWGAIDTNGHVAIPFIFDEIGFFNEVTVDDDNTPVFKAHFGGWEKGHWGVIDKQGNWLAEPIFKDLGYYYDNGVFEFYDEYRLNDDALVGLYDVKQQKVIFEPQFSDVDLNGNGTFNAEYTDKNGKLIHQTLYFDGSIAPSKTYQFTPDYIEIDDENIHTINDTTTIIHERLQENEQSFQRIKYNDKWGLCTRFGEIVLPIAYHDLFFFDEKYLICKDNDGWHCFEI